MMSDEDRAWFEGTFKPMLAQTCKAMAPLFRQERALKKRRRIAARLAEVRMRTISGWVVDCLHWRKRVLRGKHAHWCLDWDGLPVDETTPEFRFPMCLHGKTIAISDWPKDWSPGGVG